LSDIRRLRCPLAVISDEIGGCIVSYSLVEWLSEELRAVGFRTYYENGAEFLKSYFEKLQELQRERTDEEIEGNVPSPDLAQQVENDPTVKAAKLAYEEAYAKALADARKRL
jgi:hypothetical protein